MKKNLFKLFLCLLAFFVFAPDAWGAGWYHLAGTVVAVCDEGASGYVTIGPKNSYGTVLADENLEWSSTNKTCTIASYSETKYAYLCYYAKPAPGSYFCGWYKDAACTNRVASDNYGDQKVITTQRLKCTSSPYAEASWPDKTGSTYYAKFSTTPGSIFMGLEAISNNPTLGGVNPIGSANVDPTDGLAYGNLAPAYTIDKANLFVEKGAYEDLGDEIRQRIYVGALAKRGCNFVKWNVETTDNTVIVEAEGYSRYNYRTAVDIIIPKSTITTTENSIVMGKISADFEEAEPTTLTVQKKADLGTITGKYAYVVLNILSDGSTAMKQYSDPVTYDYDFPLSSIDASSTEQVYSDLYPFDEVTLTATPSAGVAFRG